MKKIIGIVGSGMVGRDPFDPKCWSRSAYNLFTNLRASGVLHRAFGVEVPHPLRGLLMLKNVHPDKDTWRQRFNLDPSYYAQLTREIKRSLRPDDFQDDHVLLQIGGHYNSAQASQGKLPAYSYHDGNIGGMMRSPYFPLRNLPYARKAFEFEKGVYQDLTKIFVMAEYWRRSFVDDFGVDPSRVVNIGFGVNVDIPPVFEKDYSRKHVVFIGTDFARKGGDNLVRAFQSLVKKHSDATLHIVGPRETPAVLSEPGLKNIEFHGYLSRENPEHKARLLGILQKGTLLMLPSLYEPFGSAPLEGMLYRMPVITTNNWSFPDFVTSDTGLMLDRPSDAKEMADKMDVFLSDPARSERAGNCGRKLVMGQYTWDHVVSRLRKEVLAN